nr:transposase (putative), gypsy type [Tanacetum cinerariifolium]
MASVKPFAHVLWMPLWDQSRLRDLVRSQRPSPSIGNCGRVSRSPCLRVSCAGGYFFHNLLRSTSFYHPATSSIVDTIISWSILDIFCRTYNILDSLEAEFLGLEDTIIDSPAGKIGIFARFIKVSVDKDPAPSSDAVDLELIEVLDKNCALFRKYPETFLGVVGLSQVYDDEDTRPTFLDSIYKEMGLFEFINTFNSFKVKIGKRALAEGEIFLLKETEDRVIPPSDEIITVVDHNITDELKDAATAKEKKRVSFDGAEPLVKKAKTTPFAAPYEKKKTASSTGKILAALKKIVTLDTLQDTSGPVAQKFTVISLDSTHAEPLTTGLSLSSKSVSNYFPKQTKAVTVTTSLVHEVGTSSVALYDTSLVNYFYEYHTIDFAKAKNVYVPKWNITNDFELDDPWLCRNFFDHIPPLGYWASL